MSLTQDVESREGAAALPRKRRAVIDAMPWDVRARGRRAKTTAQSTDGYLLALERQVEPARDGSCRGLYGREGPVQRASFGQPRDHETRQISVLIAPLDAWGLDVDAYVRRTMASTEHALSCEFKWVAINHTGEIQPHAHVVLRSLSRAADGVLADGDLVQSIQSHAQQVGPEGVGHNEGAQRPREDIFAARFTPWDFRLAELANNNSIAYGMFEHDGNLKTRMEALEMMSLAEMDLRGDRLTARTKWFLAKGWLEVLLDWSDERDTVDLTHVFAPAMDVLPWRPSVHAAHQARGLRLHDERGHHNEKRSRCP
jgi:hypothetical protein